MNFLSAGSLICGDEIPKYFIFDFSTAHPMLFYSYVPIILISFLISFFIYRKNPNSLQGRLLMLFTGSFVAWVLNILVQWVASYHTALMFAWQLTALLEVGIYVFAAYFAYVFIYKRDISSLFKGAIFLLFTLVLILTPTTLNVESYDIYNCEGVVGRMWDFIYVFELVCAILIGYFGLLQVRQTSDKLYQKQVVLFTTGIVLFLLIFFFTNLYGEITKVYEFNLWGPLGMLLFLTFFSYLIARFHLFNFKVFSSQILVFGLSALIFSLLFVNDPLLLVLIILITFVLSIIFGNLLIYSVKLEVEQKEFNKKLVNELKVTNNKLVEADRQKSEFVSFATHQLRSPLTAMKGYSSLILDGDYGELNPDLRKAIQTIRESSDTLASVVDDYLNISRIELGTMKYEFVSMDFSILVDKVLAEQMPSIEKSGISLSYVVDRKQSYPIKADPDKFKQVIMNIIDNSIKYTQKGSVNVTLTRQPNQKLLLTIRDTGIGMKQETIPELFEKFTRANNANKVNIRGTGLGLYVAKEIVKAHGGRIWAESEGEGKGSQFYIEMEEKQ
jgi:signal transduction histidine kinase